MVTSGARVSRRRAMAQWGAAGLAIGVLGRPAANAAAQEATPGPLPPLLQAYADAWNAHDDGSQFASLLTDDAVWEDVPFGLVFEGAEACAGYLVEQYTAFPDVLANYSNGLLVDNRASVEWDYTATYTGKFPDLPTGTGQPVYLRGVDILAFEGDKISRITTYYDAYALLVQLGVLPAPEGVSTPMP